MTGVLDFEEARAMAVALMMGTAGTRSTRELAPLIAAAEAERQRAGTVRSPDETDEAKFRRALVLGADEELKAIEAKRAAADLALRRAVEVHVELLKAFAQAEEREHQARVDEVHAEAVHASEGIVKTWLDAEPLLANLAVLAGRNRELGSQLTAANAWLGGAEVNRQDLRVHLPVSPEAMRFEPFARLGDFVLKIADGGLPNYQRFINSVRT